MELSKLNDQAVEKVEEFRQKPVTERARLLGGVASVGTFVVGCCAGWSLLKGTILCTAAGFAGGVVAGLIGKKDVKTDNQEA